jgi:hypothetical protein
MFYAQVLHCRRRCWTHKPPSGTVALTTGIPSGTEDYGFFKTWFQTQSQKGQKILNPAAEQRS